MAMTIHDGSHVSYSVVKEHTIHFYARAARSTSVWRNTRRDSSRPRFP
jgi:hypothetical protein